MSDKLVLEACCFTGHRPEKLGMGQEKIKKLLREEIKNAIDFGYCVFVSGMSRGVDMWAAELVLEEKKENPYIRLVCAVPFEGFGKGWEAAEREVYQRIIKEADYVRIVSKRYFGGVFQARNKWMVDYSSRVIAAYNGEPGGTKNTIDYALKNGIEVINILKKVSW